MRTRSFPARLAGSAALREPRRAAETRREALLDAAERLVAEKGLLGASLQEIGAAIGLAPYAVRAQFGSFEMVVEAVLDRHIDRLIDRVRDYEFHLDGEAADPPARLARAITTLLDMLAAYADGQRVHVAASAGASPHLVRALRLRQRHLAYFYAGLIEAAVPEAAANELAMPAALSLLGMASWHVLWFRDRGALSRAEYGRMLAHMVIAGVRATAADGIGRWETASGG